MDKCAGFTPFLQHFQWAATDALMPPLQNQQAAPLLKQQASFSGGIRFIELTATTGWDINSKQITLN